MNCPSCGSPAMAGERFCSNCGAQLPEAPAATTSEMPPTEPAQPGPVAQPTQVMPPVQQAGPPAVPPGGFAPPMVPPPPPPPSGAGTIVAIVVGGVLLLGAATVGGFLLLRPKTAEPPVVSGEATATVAATPTVETTLTGLPNAGTNESLGYPTAKAAVDAYLPIDWYSEVLSDRGSTVEYATGPPESEWTDVLVVQRQPDGSWRVVRTYAYDMGDAGVQGNQISIEEDAIDVVGRFITAVMQDRGDDAYALTVAPFSNDPASSSVSNGGLLSYHVVDTIMGNDGVTVHVRVREVWDYGTDEWTYTCVPTPNGYKISEVQ